MFFIPVGKKVYSPYRLNAEDFRVTVKKRDFKKIILGWTFPDSTTTDKISELLEKMVPAPVSPGKSRKRSPKPNEAKMESSDESSDDDDSGGEYEYEASDGEEAAPAVKEAAAPVDDAAEIAALEAALNA